MQIVFATFADDANVSVEGKLNILGMFDTIRAASIPTIHPHLVLAFQLRAEYEDGGTDKEIWISLVDADGRVIWHTRGVVSITPIPPGVFSHTPQIIHVQGLRFPQVGRYRLTISTSDGDQADCVLQVLQAGADG